jgi:hypothetical protein
MDDPHRVFPTLNDLDQSFHSASRFYFTALHVSTIQRIGFVIMFFTKFFSLALATMATLSLAAPLKSLDVVAPHVLKPAAGDVWLPGQTQTVVW